MHNLSAHPVSPVPTGVHLFTSIKTHAQLMCRLGQCFMKPAQSLSTSSSSTPLLKGHTSTFKQPLNNRSAIANTAPGATAAARQPAKPSWQHNPDAEGAVILNKTQWDQAKGSGGVTPVVVDPHIGRKLRPHQQQGVQFLYECVMGLREANRQAL